jgi:MFS family permease
MPELANERSLNQPSTLTPPLTQPLLTPRVQEEETSAEVVAGGSAAETICGIAGIVLAIVALADVYPYQVGAVGAIVLGCGLLLESFAVGTRFSKLLDEMVGSHFSLAELGGGATAGFLAGATGLVLGILTLIGIAWWVLPAVTAIVFGAGLLLGAGAISSLNNVIVERRYRNHEMARRVAGGMVSGATGAQILIGVAAIILGIVALTSLYSLTLSMVAFLIVGVAQTVSGLSLGTKMIQMVRR